MGQPVLQPVREIIMSFVQSQAIMVAMTEMVALTEIYTPELLMTI